jgi:gliding motility-associated protein GldM
MAGGKLSPRQKMINLMYLVFIAMLAMQMDKKVLSSFGFMKVKIEDANQAASVNINNILASLSTKATDQPDKYGKVNQQANQIHKESEDLFKYIADLKDSILVDTDEEDYTNYESMSGADRVDAMFFAGDENTPLGDEFVGKIRDYRTRVLGILGNDENKKDLIVNINKRFDTSDEPAREEGSPDIPWLRSRYEGMPMITTLANITQIQGDIKSTEAEVYTVLLGGQLESEVSLTNYKGIVALDKTAYFAGEKVTGKIVLGRYDSTLKPEKVILNGRDYKKIEDGQVLVDIPAGNVGSNEIKGVITFKEAGKDVPVEFSTSYSVIAEPNDAIVSADKMNVVYRGLDNPISISVPGVGNNNVNPIVSKGNKLTDNGNGKYILNPGDGDEVKINVTAKLSSGKTINTPKTFRIKDIPAAAGTVRGDFGVVRMPKTSLNNTPIAAELPDFVFDLQLEVQSFTVKVPGQLAVKVTGNKFDTKAKRILAKARRGDVITIFDIKAIEKTKGTPIKKVLPVSIEISN